MDYTKLIPTEDLTVDDGSARGDGSLWVEEPPALYGGGSAVAEAEEDVGDNRFADESEGIDWDEVDRNLPAHLTVSTPEELYEKLMEGMEAIREGRVRPIDDVVNDILRDIENGII